MAMPFTTSADGWMQSNAGGLRWRTLDDETIEVEGQGVVQAPDTGYWADAKFIDKSWDAYGDKIMEKAQRFNVPAPLILAIGIVESRWTNTPANSAGAGGFMALMPDTLHRYVPGGHMNDIDDNMDAGVGLLADLIRKYDGQIPAIAPAYNAGSAIPSLHTKCKSTIDKKWQFDGTTGENSMGFVEDCQKGHGSQYSIRVTALNNTIRARGIGTGPIGDSGPASSGGGFGTAVVIGALAGAFLGVGVTLAEDYGIVRRVFR
jgi:hypothetical protein